MKVVESEKFLRQVSELKKKYPQVEEDIDNVKDQLLMIAFKKVSELNVPIVEIDVKEVAREIWRIRVQNSDNNKGKRAGYRIFYCRSENKDDGIIFLGIYSKPDIEKDYEVIARDLLKKVVDEGRL